MNLVQRRDVEDHLIIWSNLAFLLQISDSRFELQKECVLEISNKAFRQYNNVLNSFILYINFKTKVYIK